MKFAMIVDPDYDPDAVGELLRYTFFKADREKGEVGCYMTFDWREGVEPLADLTVTDRWDDTTVWTRARMRVQHIDDHGQPTESQIECRYYWDGDGTLLFLLPDGRCLVNYDCKKDHNWEVAESHLLL